jgi:hypothetical protein
MAITIHDKALEPQKAVASALSELLEHNPEEPVLLLFSGDVCFEVLQHVKVQSLPKHLTVSVLEERYDGKNSLFLRLTDKLFYKQARDAGVVFIDVRPTSGEDLTTMGKRHDGALKAWRNEHPEGRIIALFDLANDGRIAGIVGKAMKTGEFLGLFEDSTIWAVGYHLLPSQSQNLDRVTVTLSFLRHQVDHALVISPREETDALMTILHKTHYLSEFPSIIIRDMKKVEIFTPVVV